MEQRVISMLNRVWDTIANDALELSDNGRMDKEEVIEMVLDASRPMMLGNDDEAARYIENLDYELAKELARKAFPYEEYGY